MKIFRRTRPLPEDVQLLEIRERHKLAQNIFFRRESLELTQDALAEQAGMTQAQIANLEAGHANPTHVTLTKVANALGCKIRDLYTPADNAVELVPRRFKSTDIHIGSGESEEILEGNSQVFARNMKIDWDLLGRVYLYAGSAESEPEGVVDLRDAEIAKSQSGVASVA